MEIRVRDYVWATVAGLAAGGIGWAIVNTVLSLASRPTAGGIAITLASAALTIEVGRWIMMGAWRRTAWGAPPGGVREYKERASAIRRWPARP